MSLQIISFLPISFGLPEIYMPVFRLSEIILIILIMRLYFGQPEKCNTYSLVCNLDFDLSF